MWLVGGLAVLLYGALPKYVGPRPGAGRLGRAALGWIGPALDVPQAVMDLSPFGHLPKLPGERDRGGAACWMLLLAAVLTAGGLVALRRRDIG